MLKVCKSIAKWTVPSHRPTHPATPRQHTMSNNTHFRPSGIARARPSSSGSRRRAAFARSVLRAVALDAGLPTAPRTPVPGARIEPDAPVTSPPTSTVHDDSRAEMRQMNARIHSELSIIDAAHHHTTVYLYERNQLLEREIRRMERNMRVVFECLSARNRHVDFDDNAPDVRRLSRAVTDIVRNAVPPRDDIGSVSDDE